MYGYAMSVLGDEHASEDAIATTFEQAWRDRDRFDADRGTLDAWVWMILRSRTLDELRRRSRHAQPTDTVPDLAGPAGADPDVTRAVRDLVAALPEEQRELLGLRYWADLPSAQIAQIMDLSEAAVNVRLSRLASQLSEHPSWKGLFS